MMATPYEYLVRSYMTRNDEDLQEHLNLLGNNGWELVSCGLRQGRLSSWDTLFVFKRLRAYGQTTTGEK